MPEPGFDLSRASAALPVAVALIGREVELARAEARIEPGRGFVTLLGPPGIGKTSLAAELARRQAEHVPARFVDVSTQRTIEGLCARVSAAFSSSEHEPDAVAAILARQGPAFVVLDNFEQLAFAAAIVQSWVGAASEIAFVVTSRERLAVDAERVVELAPLGLPRREDRGEAVRASEAYRLFAARAEAAGGRLAGEDEDVAEIVRRLDGLPLAIELAAARTRVMSPSELARRLGDRGELLALGKRAPDRHRTLARAIAWSWELLRADERTMLVVCSTFASDFAIASVEALCARARLGALAVTTLLAGLREQSLVHAVGPGRLGVFASVREFARSEGERGDPERAERLAAEHAALMAERAAAFNRSLIFFEGAAGVEADIADFERALEFARDGGARFELTCALGLLQRIPPERALDLIGDRSRLDAPARSLARLVAHQAQLGLGRPDDALAELLAVIDDDDASEPARAFAAMSAGAHRRVEGRADDALALHRRADAMLEATPRAWPRLRAVNQACLGRLACDRRDLEQARALNCGATATCEALGEGSLAAFGIANLAQLEQERGALELAEGMLADAIARFRAAGRHRYEGTYAAVCGGLYLEWGRLDEARDWYAAGEAALQRRSSSFPELLLHGGRAMVEARAGEGTAARVHLQAARRAVARFPTALAERVLAVQTCVVDLGARPSRVEAERARALLEGPEPDNLDLRFVRRVLRASLDEPATPTLEIGREGLGFRVGAGDWVDLSRRKTLRRIVAALARLRTEQPGRGLDAGELFAEGWPGQTIQVAAAGTRVRVAVSTLRTLGLRGVLITRDDGYSFDPSVAVIWVEGP